jgi:hypothetical protein
MIDLAFPTVRIPHRHAPLLEQSPDCAVVDAELRGDGC